MENSHNRGMRIRMKETAESIPHVNYLTYPVNYSVKLFNNVTISGTS